MNIKYKDIPYIKETLMELQENKCVICQRNLKKLKKRDICLDHNHKTGKIRSVLCRGCNSMEGKVHRAFVRVGLQNQGVNYQEFLMGLCSYVDFPETDIIHPSYKRKK